MRHVKVKAIPGCFSTLRSAGSKRKTVSIKRPISMLAGDIYQERRDAVEVMYPLEL